MNAASGATPEACGAAPRPGLQPLVRLTNAEYRNTVRDLFGDVVASIDLDLPDETIVGGFDTNAAGQTPSLVLLEAYQGAAKAIATAATSPTALPRIAPCANAASEEACGGELIKSLGKRAFRRTLSADEATRLGALFKGARAAAGYRDAVATVVQALLLSPQFLYRIETGGAPVRGQEAVPLTSFELATRLSYLLWDTMPDAQLLAAADADALRTPTALEEQARRLLADPRAKEAVARFHAQWLELDRIDDLQKDAGRFPKWNDAVARSLKTSAERFVDRAFWTEGKLSALLTDRRAFVDGAQAWIYDVAAPAAGMELVDVGAGKRAGILTQAGVLAAHAKPGVDSPVHRGLFVLDRLLCTKLPDPPGNVPPLEETRPGDPPKTTRQRFEQSHSPPECAVCHKLIDGVGFGFGHYDAVGRWRNDEGGVPVDVRSALAGTRDIDGPFTGAIELGARLARSEQVAACVATQWFRYGFGRTETEADACALAPIARALAGSNGDMKALLVAIVKSDAFRYRTPAAAEGAKP
jgi:hypothetical protein